MAVALVKLRLRWMFSLGCAVVAIPLVLITVLRLAVFSLYYRYVLSNQTGFESEAKAETQPGLPAFAKLEGRDVSVGLAINPPTFTSIVYDESDELGLDPAKRSAGWNARNGTHLSMDGGGISHGLHRSALARPFLPGVVHLPIEGSVDIKAILRMSNGAASPTGWQSCASGRLLRVHLTEFALCLNDCASDGDFRLR